MGRRQASPGRWWPFVQPLTRAETNGPKDICKMTIDENSISMLIILSPTPTPTPPPTPDTDTLNRHCSEMQFGRSMAPIYCSTVWSAKAQNWYVDCLKHPSQLEGCITPSMSLLGA